MKNKFNLLSLLIVGSVYSQIGIETSSPEATLDVRGKNHLGSVTSQDGLLIPRVSNLSAAGSVNGQLVYLIQNSGSFVKGFHYWNNTDWTPFTEPAFGDPSIDAWVDNPQNKRVELGAKSDGSTRSTGTEFVAQDNGNVGIGTSTPNDTAILDLTSNNKGLKLPYVNIQSLKDVTTITNPADGLMIYNPGTTTSLQNGVYVFDESTQSWAQLQNFSESKGPKITKIIYASNSGDENKVLTVEKYRFRVNSNNTIQISHSQPTAPRETLIINDNLFRSPDRFLYSAPKSITVTEGNENWVGSPGSIAANLNAGTVNTLYFSDPAENRFYRVLFFRSANSPTVFSIVGEVF